MRKKFFKVQIIGLIVLSTTLATVSSASALALVKPGTKAKINNSTQELAGTAGYEAANKDTALFLVQTAINIFLSLIGVLLLVLILYAGYNWLTARGEEEKVTKAKDTLKRAITGIIIIIAAYAISVFVMGKIEQGTLKGGRGGVGGYTQP